MHHHQAESGMKEKDSREMDGVARRHGVIEIMRLTGNKEKIIPVKEKKKSEHQDYSQELLHFLLFSI